MQVGQSDQGNAVVTATVVAVTLAAVLTTLVTTYGTEAETGATHISGRPPAPLEAPVVEAAPSGRTPASVLGGPPAPACESPCEPEPEDR
jgi:hypothetical protein